MADCILDDRRLTARKAHRCNHCLSGIEVGQFYWRTRQIWEGDASTFKAHVECVDAENAYRKLACLGWDEGVLLHELESDDHEWLLAEYPTVAGRLGLTSSDKRTDR